MDQNGNCWPPWDIDKDRNHALDARLPGSVIGTVAPFTAELWTAVPAVVLAGIRLLMDSDLGTDLVIGSPTDPDMDLDSCLGSDLDSVLYSGLDTGTAIGSNLNAGTAIGSG